MRVVIESPFMGTSEDEETRSKETRRNIKYARACYHDSLRRRSSLWFTFKFSAARSS